MARGGRTRLPDVAELAEVRRRIERWTQSSPELGASSNHRENAAAFIELKVPESAASWGDPAGVVVELSSVDGARLVIRVRSGESIDVLALVEAFWRRRA